MEETKIVTETTEDVGSVGVINGDGSASGADSRTDTGVADVSLEPVVEQAGPVSVSVEILDENTGICDVLPEPVGFSAKNEGCHFSVILKIDDHDVGLKPKLTEAKIVGGKMINMWTGEEIVTEQIESLQVLGFPGA